MKPPKGGALPRTFGGWLKLDNSTLQTDCDGVRAVTGAEFGQYVCHVGLDGRFSNRELITNLLIGVSAAYQLENFDFACSQFVICGMLGEFRSYFWRDTFFPGMNAADGFEQLPVYVAL